MIELHYIDLLKKKQEEIDKLRSTLFEILQADFLSKEDRQLILNNFFNDNKE
jgi:hypothetical protein|tara:strand:- start:508 stop:663 length:156 start_codon:yes stop_codon:yes gene_type:complete